MELNEKGTEGLLYVIAKLGELGMTVEKAEQDKDFWYNHAKNQEKEIDELKAKVEELHEKIKQYEGGDLR